MSVNMNLKSELIESVISQMISLVSYYNLFNRSRLQSKFTSLASELISLVFSLDLDLDSKSESESELISHIKQIIRLAKSVSESGHESQVVSLVAQMCSHITSTNWDPKSEPEPEIITLAIKVFSLLSRMEVSDSKLVSVIAQITALVDENQQESESKLISLLGQLHSLRDPKKLMSVIIQIISLVRSMDSKPKTELMSLTAQTFDCFKSMDLDTQPDPLRKLISFISQNFYESLDWKSLPEMEQDQESSELMTLYGETLTLEPLPELVSLIQEIMSLVDSNPEPRLKSLITKLIFLNNFEGARFDYDSKFISLGIQIISLVSSIDSDTQPKPESELMSLIMQSISVFNSIELDSLPEPLRKLISLGSRISSFINFRDSDPKPDLDREFLDLLEKKSRHDSEDSILNSLHERLVLLVSETMRLEPAPELISLLHQILSLVMSMNSKWNKLISFCPQLQVISKQGKFHVIQRGSWSLNHDWDFLLRYATGGEEQFMRKNSNNWDCLPFNWEKFNFSEEEEEYPYFSHFLCRVCYGENHKGYNKAPVEINHHLHPKHSLQLALFFKDDKTRQCYCCDETFGSMLYYCRTCDFGILFSCAEKPPVLSIDRPKWHEHTLALFPSKAPLTCSLCALTHSNCPFYICPPCDFVVHQSCFNLPHVIRISRHLHRISFTPNFQKADWSCGICRKRINNDYGGYHCIKDDCMYAVHSKCATQKNVWDGIELQGEPEEDIEELEPFLTISDGIIQHFSHKHHHLRLDENTGIDYNDNKLCQACITPIYFGNFYSCLQCDFILHQDCANLSRIKHHPIHPHLLTLVTDKPLDKRNILDLCSACPSLFIAGFFYECSERLCNFSLHLQCATISEPLVHPSHMHPLFLTSKPDEERICSVCKKASDFNSNKETFNCIEECEFALCFTCATLPQKVRYKHDKHILPLSYGEETSTMTNWCEACEGKLDMTEGFYKCDEYCCVTLHIKCMLGKDLYVKPGSSWSDSGGKPRILSNNMSRPICPCCNKRCPHKILFKLYGFVFCSKYCMSSWIHY